MIFYGGKDQMYGIGHLMIANLEPSIRFIS